MSTLPATSSTTTSSTGSAPSVEASGGGTVLHEESTNIWITLGGLALGVGGFFLAQGLHHLYRQQQQKEKQWVQKWSSDASETHPSSSSKQGGASHPTSTTAQKCIYLDYNGTTPVYKDVIKAMLPYLEDHFGNPSSGHAYGTIPRVAIEQARRQILYSLLQAPEENDDDDTDEERLESIWFTGCGTESDNLAIQLALQSCPMTSRTTNSPSNGIKNQKRGQPKKHIVTSNVEHPAIANYLKHLLSLDDTSQLPQGSVSSSSSSSSSIEVTFVPVQPDGRVLASDVIAAIKDTTVLVTIMLANNESGALQPVKEISMECRRRGVLFHTDAAQAAGKTSCALSDLGDPDMITIVGHKMGAPKGIAALYVRPGCLEERGRVMPQSSKCGGVMLIGGGQEFGRRGGTENTPYIVALGYAAQKAQENLVRNAAHMEALRSRLLKRLQDQLGGKENVRANGPKDPSLRLCNTLSVGIKNVHSGQLLATIGHLVAASAGAACHSSDSVSAVLQAMNVPMEFARGTLRLSVGPQVTTQEIDRAAWIIAETVKLQWSGELLPKSAESE